MGFGEIILFAISLMIMFVGMAGIICSVIGTGVGFFLGGPIGLILGPVVGTVLFELIGGKGYKGALKSGLGNFVGFLGGSLIKIIIGLTMISVFVWKVFG